MVTLDSLALVRGVDAAAAGSSQSVALETPMLSSGSGSMLTRATGSDVLNVQGPCTRASQHGAPVRAADVGSRSNSGFIARV